MISAALDEYNITGLTDPGENLVHSANKRFDRDDLNAMQTVAASLTGQDG